VPDVWEIVLLVWIVVIPATVALLTSLAAKRRAAADRLIATLIGVVPEWSEMISKVARRAARG